MSTKNLAWLRDKVARKLNFNVSQTDQDFAGPASDAYKLIDDYINEAYLLEVNRAKVEIGAQPFRAQHSFTWAASSVTLTLPQHLLDQQMERLDDETDQTPGTTLWVSDRPSTGSIAWYDRNTLIWGSTGPASARTLKAFYLAAPQELKSPLAEPSLVPPDHRWLIVWSAAIIGRSEADERAPEKWEQHLATTRNDYHALLSRGVIMTPGYLIKEASPNHTTFVDDDSTAGIGGGIG